MSNVWSNRAILESTFTIRLAELHKHGHIRLGEQHFERHLRSSDGKAGRISLSLMTTDTGARIGGVVQHGRFEGIVDIRLISQSRHFGGRQFYFVCPTCGRRCTVLYVSPKARLYCWKCSGARYFLCAHHRDPLIDGARGSVLRYRAGYLRSYRPRIARKRSDEAFEAEDRFLDAIHAMLERDRARLEAMAEKGTYRFALGRPCKSSCG